MSCDGQSQSSSSQYAEQEVKVFDEEAENVGVSVSATGTSPDTPQTTLTLQALQENPDLATTATQEEAHDFLKDLSYDELGNLHTQM